MAQLDRVWVIHTTSREKDAGTDASFDLHLPAGGKAADSVGHQIRFPGQPHDERERGRTDQYEFDVRSLAIDADEARNQLSMVTRGGNAWLPSSIWAIGRSVDGAFHLLACNPRWPSNGWFSTDKDEGKTSRQL